MCQTNTLEVLYTSSLPRIGAIVVIRAFCRFIDQVNTTNTTGLFYIQYDESSVLLADAKGSLEIYYEYMY